MDPKWFHITCHTYGAWLYGDARGFRTRHHREHVVGDYKNPPPPGTYDRQLARSRALLKQEPVLLEPRWWPVFGGAVKDRMTELGTQLLVVSLGATHLHLLGKMPGGHVPRQWVGRAKVYSNFKAKEHGYTGKLWAVRCKVIPIKDRRHQLNCFYYILDHLHERAWVWDFRNPDNPRTSESPGPYGPGLSPEWRK
jgi:hypothetical protein